MRWIVFFFLSLVAVATVEAAVDYSEFMTQLIEMQSESKLQLEPSFSVVGGRVKSVGFPKNTCNSAWVVVFTPTSQNHLTILSFEAIGEGCYLLPEFEVWQQHSRVVIVATAFDYAGDEPILLPNGKFRYTGEVKKGECGIGFFSYTFRGETPAIDALIEEGFSLDGIKNIVFCPYTSIKYGIRTTLSFTPMLFIIEGLGGGTEIQYVRKGIGSSPEEGLESVIESALFQAPK